MIVQILEEYELRQFNKYKINELDVIIFLVLELKIQYFKKLIW